MAITHVQTTYLSCFFESLFLGVHCVLIGVVVWLWTSRKTANKVHLLLYVLMFIMFLLAMIHATSAVGKWMLPDTFGVNKSGTLISQLLGILQFMFGDIIIIWRTWMIWNKNYSVVLVPICLTGAAVGFAFASAGFEIVSPSLFVANSMLCTGLIIGRILYVSIKNKSSENALTAIRKSPYKGIIFLLAETGTVYMSFQIASLILFTRDSPMLSVVLNLMVPVQGILPSTIVVLAAFEALPGDAGKTTVAASTLRFRGAISSQSTNNFTHTTDIGTGHDTEETTASQKESALSSGVEA